MNKSERTTRCPLDRKSTRLNSSHSQISYAVFCLKTKNQTCHVQGPSSLPWGPPHPHTRPGLEGGDRRAVTDRVRPRHRPQHPAAREGGVQPPGHPHHRHHHHTALHRHQGVTQRQQRYRVREGRRGAALHHRRRACRQPRQLAPFHPLELFFLKGTRPTGIHTLPSHAVFRF